MKIIAFLRRELSPELVPLIEEILRYESAVDQELGCCHDTEGIVMGTCRNSVPERTTAFQILATSLADRPGFRTSWTYKKGNRS